MKPKTLKNKNTDVSCSVGNGPPPTPDSESDRLKRNNSRTNADTSDSGRGRCNVGDKYQNRGSAPMCFRLQVQPNFGCRNVVYVNNTVDDVAMKSLRQFLSFSEFIWTAGDTKVIKEKKLT